MGSEDEMKVLVTGAASMLARDLVPCLQGRGHAVLALTHPELDITDQQAVRRNAASFRPALIINCAAYNSVDDAEEEEHLAATVNGLGVHNLCLVCQERDIPLVHFSTDYVFDGAKDGPYTVYDQPNPINAYGRSKLLGEKYVLWLLNRFCLIRTSWLFGAYGSNFVETMLTLAQEGKQVSVVTDQKGCPTWTQSLSEAVADLIESGRYGIYHATNSGPTTRFDYAMEIFRLAGTGTKVLPITTDHFPRPARRPLNSVLDPFPLPLVLGRQMPPWQEALAQYLEKSKGMEALKAQARNPGSRTRTEGRISELQPG